jgi:hypothetical protein
VMMIRKWKMLRHMVNRARRVIRSRGVVLRSPALPTRKRQLHQLARVGPLGLRAC